MLEEPTSSRNKHEKGQGIEEVGHLKCEKGGSDGPEGLEGSMQTRGSEDGRKHRERSARSYTAITKDETLIPPLSRVVRGSGGSAGWDVGCRGVKPQPT